MKKNEDKWLEILRNDASDIESKLNPEVWRKIEGRLDNRSGVKRSARMRLYSVAAMIAFILFVGSALYMVNDRQIRRSNTFQVSLLVSEKNNIMLFPKYNVKQLMKCYDSSNNVR